jgi:hypothetical protein
VPPTLEPDAAPPVAPPVLPLEPLVGAAPVPAFVPELGLPLPLVEGVPELAGVLPLFELPLLLPPLLPCVPDPLPVPFGVVALKEQAKVAPAATQKIGVRTLDQ